MYRQPRKSSAKTRPRRFFETGQGLVEYALIIAMVALLAIGATLYLGGQVKGTLSSVGTAANGAVLGANQGGPTPAPTPAPTAAPTPTPTAAPTPTPNPYPQVEGGRCDGNPSHQWHHIIFFWLCF